MLITDWRMLVLNFYVCNFFFKDTEMSNQLGTVWCDNYGSWKRSASSVWSNSQSRVIWYYCRLACWNCYTPIRIQVSFVKMYFFICSNHHYFTVHQCLTIFHSLLNCPWCCSFLFHSIGKISHCPCNNMLFFYFKCSVIQ